jgi:hypothetical protein
MRDEFERPDAESDLTVAERLDRMERRQDDGFDALLYRLDMHFYGLAFIIIFQHWLVHGLGWGDWLAKVSADFNQAADWLGTLPARTVDWLGTVVDRAGDVLRVIQANAGDLIALAVMGLLLSFCLWPARQCPGQEEPSEQISFRLGKALRRVIRPR